MKTVLGTLIIALFIGTTVHAAQVDCTIGLNAPDNVRYKAEFYGGGTGEVIKENFNLNGISLNLRVLVDSSKKLFIQLNTTHEEPILLSAEGFASESKSLFLIFSGKIISPKLEGVSFGKCSIR